MADHSTIEWTDATWNPVTGCTKVSTGCDRCYAESFAERFRGVRGHHFEAGFDLVLRPARLTLPLTWRRPRRVFVTSMSDLFHGGIDTDYVAQVFAVMCAAGQHTFQVLTKRPGRAASLLVSDIFRSTVHSRLVDLAQPAMPDVPELVWPLPNVHLGVSVEDQASTDLRVPKLLDAPAAVHWISAEPLLGPIRLQPDWLAPRAAARWAPGHTPTVGDHAMLAELARAAVRHHARQTSEPRPAYVDWVVAGGESGAGARPMHPDWPRGLRDQCAATAVAFHFKQWGQFAPVAAVYAADGSELLDDTDLAATGSGCAVDPDGTVAAGWTRRRPHRNRPPAPGAWWMRRSSKPTAGRELDGRLHDGQPEAGRR